MSADIFKVILIEQSKARWRRDWKAVQFWEQVEFALKDALAEFYGGAL